MKQWVKIHLLLLCLSLIGSTHAQQLSLQNNLVKGIIVDDSTEQRIAFVHLYNESQHRGYIADEKGSFIIPAAKGDTLVISSIGYRARVVVLSASRLEMENRITLTPQIYEIDEVRVRAFKDYDDFRRQFLALKLPETPTDVLRNNLAAISHLEAKEAYTKKQMDDRYQKSGVEILSIGVPIRSKADRQMENYTEILKKEERQKIIDKKYNREIIYDITHLSEDELTEFMSFCYFSEEYLYSATEYEILVKIEEKFKEFKLWKENGSFWNDKFNSTGELFS
jgi:hypothetical protein